MLVYEWSARLGAQARRKVADAVTAMGSMAVFPIGPEGQMCAWPVLTAASPTDNTFLEYPACDQIDPDSRRGTPASWVGLPSALFALESARYMPTLRFRCTASF